MAASYAAEAPLHHSIDYRRLGLLSLGHLTNDMYGNVLTALMPYLVLRHAITTTVAGLVVLVYLAGSSIPQPFLGVLSDRSGKRFFVVLGPLSIGVAASSVGWAPNAFGVALLALLGGLGTSSFHPQAAAMVNGLSKARKGWGMSLFSMGGNLGFALGPLAAGTLALVGLHWSPVLMLPGLVVCALLALFAPTLPRARAGVSGTGIRSAFAGSWRPLSLIVSVIALRSAVQYALILFLPLYLHERGFSPQIGSYLAFVLSIAGALGGLAGGRLSDRYGRRLVVVSTLLLSVPLLYASLLATGPLAWPLIALAGAALLASNSVTVVQGQELLPGNAGVASGLTLGIAFGLSGLLGAALTTASDHIGIVATIFIAPTFALIAAIVSVFVGAQRSARTSASIDRAAG